jgi:tetratricopeptide (TPR) repeat protein
MDPDTLDLTAAWSLIVAERLTVPGNLGTATPADAAAAARGVVSAVEGLDDPDLRGRCLLLAGDALTAVDEYDDAEDALLRAIDAFRNGPDWALGWAYLRLVRVAAFERANFAEADRLRELARVPLQRSGDLHLLAYWTLVSGNRARLQSRFPDAYEFSVDAAARFEEIGSDVSQVEALRYAVLSAKGLGRYRQAAEHIDRMLAITRRRGLATLESSARLLALDVLLAEGSAEEVLDRVTALGRTPMPDLLIERARCIEADALTAAGRADEADALIPGIEAAAERDLPWGRAAAMMTVGEAHLGAGRASEAIRALRVAVEGYAVLPTPHGISDAVEAIAVASHDAPAELVARMLGVVGALRDDVGAVPSVARRERNRKLTTATARRMQPDEFTAAWQDGADMATDTSKILRLAGATEP